MFCLKHHSNPRNNDAMPYLQFVKIRFASVLLVFYIANFNSAVTNACEHDCQCKLLPTTTHLDVGHELRLLIRNFKNTHSVICAYSPNDHDSPELSHLINETVGKLEIHDTKIEVINQEFEPFKNKLTQLRLINVGLTNVSADAFHPENVIKLLDLSNNHLVDLEFISATFHHLQALILKSNQLETVSSTAFTNQSWLAVVDLSDNKITSLDWFASSVFPELQVFNMHDNMIEVLPDNLFAAKPEVILVDLARNQLTNVKSKQMKNMTKLGVLDLTENLINYTSPSVFLLMPHLKKLVLTGNNLKAFYYNVNDTKDHSNAEVEEAMKNGEAHNHHTDSIITDLADLRLSSNKIKYIDINMQDSLKRMGSLEYLHIEDNQIIEIPHKCFDGLKNLKLVKLNMNPIKRIYADSFNALFKLHALSLLANGDYLSLDMSESHSLVSMKKVDFQSARLTKIISPLLEGMPNAEILYLQNNLLRKVNFLASKSHKNKHLVKINLSRNLIEIVDETSFANHVESVESIDLHQNLLKTFDLGYLSHMHHLKFLDMSHNKLVKFSAYTADHLYLLQKLEIVNLTNNFIVSLDYMQNIHYKSLTTLLLSDNHLTTLPDCMLADAHRPPQLRKLEYSRNTILCDCTNAWIREINERVFEVMHSQCKGTAYMADTFPTTTCTSQQLHKLGKIRCIALSQKPSLGVLLTFALANLFLLTIIVGGYLNKKCKNWKERRLRRSTQGMMSELLTSSLKLERIAKEANVYQRKQPSKVLVNETWELPDYIPKNSLISGSTAGLASTQAKPSQTMTKSAAAFASAGLGRPSNRKSASRGVAVKGTVDDSLHADLIRRLHNMEQTEFTDHTPPMSIHASHENFGMEAHEGFMNVMKDSRSAGNLRNNGSYREGIHNSQIIQVFDMPNNSPASSRRSTTKPVVASGETRVVDPNQVSLLMPGSRNNSQSTAVPYAAGGSGGSERALGLHTITETHDDHSHDHLHDLNDQPHHLATISK